MKTLFSYGLTLEEAEELIKNGADVNEIYSKDENQTPLFFAKKIELMRLLIQHGANVNHQNHNKLTPASYTKDIEALQLFIDHGALLNIRDIYGATLLDHQNGMYNLMFQDHIDNAKLLIAHGAIAGRIEGYQLFRELFTPEQQKAFDAFSSITNNDEDFFRMCLAYQESIKNHVKINIKDMDIL